jgi:sporulation-control protein
MDRILSKVGIGAAEVDTVFPKTTVRTGESVDVRVDIEGGTTEQEIDGIYFDLAASYQTDSGTETFRVASVEATESMTIGPDDERSLPATLAIPRETPLTNVLGSDIPTTDVWLDTGLDIDLAVDPDDRDAITVQPGGRVRRLFEALDTLGFRLHDMEYKSAPATERRFGPPLVQEFELIPREAPFVGQMEELEVVPVPLEKECRAYVSVDRHTDIVDEDVRADESGEMVSFRGEDATALRKELRGVIRKHIHE